MKHICVVPDVPWHVWYRI